MQVNKFEIKIIRIYKHDKIPSCHQIEMDKK